MITKKPFPHQEVAIKIMSQKNKGDRHIWLCADDMGLGKTGSTISTTWLSEMFPVLVIVPSSLKYNWEKEIYEFTGKKALILTKEKKLTWQEFYKAGIYHYFIVNYESLKSYFIDKVITPRSGAFDYYRQINNNPDIIKITGKKGEVKEVWVMNENHKIFKAVLVDECHRIKSSESQQTKIVARLCYNKQMVIGITGTPFVNSLIDPITILTTMGWYNKKEYEDLCDKYIDYKNKDIERYAKTIHNVCYFRRSKDEVGGLPAKIRKVIYVDLDDRTEYDKCLSHLADYLKEYKEKTNKEIQASLRNKARVMINYLKEICSRAKVNSLKDFISDCREKQEKVIIFADNVKATSELKEYYDALSVFGSDSKEYRNYAVNEFQTNKEKDLIFCSLKAGGVGLTLTASRIVAFLQAGWHPAIMVQAEDRAHRIGQKRDVLCVNFVAKNTIEEKILSIIETKRLDANTLALTYEKIKTEFSELENFILDVELEKIA